VIRSTVPTLRRATLALLILLAGASSLPADVDAQVRRGRVEPQEPPWMPITIGGRGGWEQEQLGSGGTIGAEVHIPVVRDGRFELVPSFDAIFLNVQDEYQYNLDALFVPGGRRGGVYIGGGVAWRESLLAGVGQDVGRANYFGYNIVVGGKNQIGPVQILLGLRWLLLTDTAFDPSAVNVGLSIPLWSSRATPQR
jgi:hypothetical protein